MCHRLSFFRLRVVHPPVGSETGPSFCASDGGFQHYGHTEWLLISGYGRHGVQLLVPPQLLHNGALLVTPHLCMSSASWKVYTDYIFAVLFDAEDDALTRKSQAWPPAASLKGVASL
eukprot:543948-Amphidinium_carterae.3